MTRSMSVYLDLLRFAAAVVVVLHHLASPLLTDNYEVFSRYGEDAVMVFFVLSGFVIAHITEAKEGSLRLYASARLARLYSVALPALLITLLLDYFGRYQDSSLYEGWYENSFPWIRAIVSLAFLNQLWSFDIHYFSNLPYWSISYEFWYYVFFALILFFRRWWAIALWVVIVGPCILLLLPVWLCGVLIYRLSKTFSVDRSIAISMLLGPVALYVLYSALGLRDTITAFSDSIVVPITGSIYFLHKARFFLHDYVLTALLSVHFLGAAALFRTCNWTVAAKQISTVASYTFSLYLLHFPLAYCLASASPWGVGDFRRDVYLIVGVALVVWMVGAVCEPRKNDLRRMILAIWDRFLRRSTGSLDRPST